MTTTEDDPLTVLQATAAPEMTDTAESVLNALTWKPSDPEDDPFADLDQPTGDLEQDASVEIDAIAQGFRKRATQENDRFRRATDSEFWFCVCFTDRESKDRFLTEHGLAGLGDKYLDGAEVHRVLLKSSRDV